MNKKDVDILITIIERSGGKTSISQLSKAINLDYKTVYGIVKRLEKKNIISLEKFGKAYNITLNIKNHFYLFEAEYKRRENLLKNSDLKVLYHKLNNLTFPFICLVFGSYARGKAVKGSDIDLLIICEENRENNVEGMISILPLDIHLTVLSFSEFISMAQSTEFTVVSEAIKNNIILIGIEDYYRILENLG